MCSTRSSGWSWSSCASPRESATGLPSVPMPGAMPLARPRWTFRTRQGSWSTGCSFPTCSTPCGCSSAPAWIPRTSIPACDSGLGIRWGRSAFLTSLESTSRWRSARAFTPKAARRHTRCRTGCASWRPPRSSAARAARTSSSTSSCAYAACLRCLPERSQMTSASEIPWRFAASLTSSHGSCASGRSSHRASSRASSAPRSAGPRCSSDRSTALSTSSCFSVSRTTNIAAPSLVDTHLAAGCARLTHCFRGQSPSREYLGNTLSGHADGLAHPAHAEIAGLRRLFGRRSGRNGAVLARDDADAHRHDAVLPHRLDANLVAVGGDHVAALRQAPQFREHVPADGVEGVRIHRELDSRVLEVADRHVAAHVPVAVGQAPQRGRTRVGLILDLTHDLLQDVLDGHDPDGPPVLVGDDAERGALTLELGQQVVEGLRLGEDRHIADRGLDRRVRARVHVEAGDAVVVDDAANLVRIVVLDDHEPGMARRNAAPQRLLDRLVGVHRHDGRDGRHDLARLLLVEVEDTREVPGLTKVERPA